jgi:hypothetical protein
MGTIGSENSGQATELTTIKTDLICSQDTGVRKHVKDFMAISLGEKPS